MRLTLGHILGAGDDRLVNPEGLSYGQKVFEVNHAVQELYLKVRDAWNERTRMTTKIHLVADQDVYPLPREVADLTKVERFDLADKPVRVEPHPYDRTDEVEASTWYPAPYTYTHLPGEGDGPQSIRLMQKPAASLEEGLRLTFLAQPVELLGLGDTPVLPEPIHEAVIALYLERLAQKRGIQFVNPRGVAEFIARMEDAVTRYLHPSHVDRQPEVVDEDPFYQEVL